MLSLILRIFLSCTLSIFSTISFTQSKKEVLFIGNSITYFNQMPETFENVCNANQDSVNVTVHALGGTGIANHAVNQNVYKLFRENKWDFVIIQPGTSESAATSFPIAATTNRTKQLLDSIYNYSPCAEVLLYEISNGVYGNSQSDLDSYNNSLDLIRSNMEYLADSTKLYFAPVGEAFKASWNQDLNTLLWNSTGDIHPNPLGSYFSACVFYASIFKKPSLNTSVYNGFSQNQAHHFQHLADSVVLQYQDSWRMGRYDQIVDFTYNSIDPNIQFQSAAQQYDSLLWDFGDQQFSRETSPIHQFHSPGNFTVSLTSFYHGCELTTQKDISVGTPLSTIGFDDSNMSIFPNPAHDYIQVQQDNFQGILKLLDLNGKVLFETTQNRIHIAHLTSGIYFLQYTSRQDKKTLMFKFVKE